MTIAEFEARFTDEEACKRYLVARRWPNGVECPRCYNKKVFPVGSMPFKWQCYECEKQEGSGYRFSLTVDTIFENTNKPLREWFRVVHLMLTSKKGISSLQIQRIMGFGSYETALNMTHKIRTALVEPEKKLGGIVEVDETYIGGKAINKHRDKRVVHGGTGGKTPIIGAISRKGNVITRVLQKVTRETAERFINESVSNKVSLLATDESSVYRYLEGYPHAAVDHRAKQYVVGAVHTNTIEGFWSIFKRGIVGTFHKVSAKYMPLYVAEFQFRYNNRFNSDIFGAAIEGC
jgi:transposase-like protein